MKHLLTLALLGIALAGCSSRPNASTPAKEIPPNNSDIANVAPEGRMTEKAASDGTRSPLPAVTVPPPILLTPVQGNKPVPYTTNSVSSENWRTFTSPVLGVAVNYPPDWSVTEDPMAVTFSSPSGATIQLKETAATANNNEFKVANQYCTSRTNEHDQTAEICVDNAAFIYTAKFALQTKEGSTRSVMLVTKTRTVGDVFEIMFNSLQPAG